MKPALVERASSAPRASLSWQLVLAVCAVMALGCLALLSWERRPRAG